MAFLPKDFDLKTFFDTPCFKNFNFVDSISVLQSLLPLLATTDTTETNIGDKNRKEIARKVFSLLTIEGEHLDNALEAAIKILFIEHNSKRDYLDFYY